MYYHFIFTGLRIKMCWKNIWSDINLPNNYAHTVVSQYQVRGLVYFYSQIMFVYLSITMHCWVLTPTALPSWPKVRSHLWREGQQLSTSEVRMTGLFKGFHFPDLFVTSSLGWAVELPAGSESGSGSRKSRGWSLRVRTRGGVFSSTVSSGVDWIKSRSLGLPKRASLLSPW